MTSNEHHENKVSDGYSVELSLLVVELLGSHVRSFSIEMVEEGLILRGSCNSFHTKQMVQEIVAKNTSFRIFLNDLVVIEL